MNRYQRNDLVKVIKLHWDKKRLGGSFISEERWLARREGALGLVFGENVMANDVYFVVQDEEGKPTMAAYGVDEIEAVEDEAAKLKLAVMRLQLRFSKE